MLLTRRSVVRLASVASFAPLLPGCTGEKEGDDTAEPTPTRSPEPPPWEAPGSEDLAAFASALRVGDATATGAVVSVRTAEPSLTLVVMEASGESWVELDRVPVTTGDGGAIVVLDGLSADTAYALAAYADDARRTGVVRLRTAPTEARVIQFGATSCLGTASPQYPSLAFVAADALDFFLLLGDTVYADDAATLEEYRAYWDAQVANTNVRAALASTSLVATWDDHEVANNWSAADLEKGQLEAALQAFREAMPQGAGPTGAIWRKLSWGPAVDVFVLDCRSERGDGHYISPAQMAWLQDGLATSTARFKIILNSVPITDLTPIFLTAEIDDRWDGYPEDRAAILGFIQEQAIGGVVWVTGDVHFAAVAHIDPAGGVAAGAWEVFVGSAGSTPMALVELYPEDEQYPFLSAAWNWARFTCDPGLGTVRVEFVGDDGAVFHDTTLTV